MHLAASIVSQVSRQAPNRQVTVGFWIQHQRVGFDNQQGVTLSIGEMERGIAGHGQTESAWAGIRNPKYGAILRRRLRQLPGVPHTTNSTFHEHSIEPAKQRIAPVTDVVCALGDNKPRHNEGRIMNCGPNGSEVLGGERDQQQTYHCDAPGSYAGNYGEASFAHGLVKRPQSTEAAPVVLRMRCWNRR